MDGGQQADGSVGSAALEVVQALVDEGGEALPDAAFNSLRHQQRSKWRGVRALEVESPLVGIFNHAGR